MNEVKRDKLFRVLDSLINPDIHSINNSCYLEMLITHLSGKGKCPDEDAHGVLKSPKILDWIEAAVTKLEGGTCPEPHVIAFILRLIGLVIAIEWQFSMVKEKMILDRIQKVLRSLPPAKQTPTVQLANVVLLNAVARHTMGLYWIKQNAIWRVIVEYSMKNQTVYVVREALTFLYTIIKQFSVTIGDNEFVEEILQTVCQPMMEGNPFKDAEANPQDMVILVDDHEQLSKIVPALNIICHILEEMITANECHEVARLLVGKFNIQHFLWGLADLAQDHTFIGRLMHGHVLLNFTQSMLRRSQPNHEEADFNNFGVNFFNYMSFCVMRRSGMNILTMAEQYHSLWSKIQPPPPVEVVIEGERICFEDQVVVLQILPIIYVTKSCPNRESRRDHMDSYIIKLFNISCGRTIRLIYSLRTMMDQLDRDYVAHLATKAIQAVMSLKDTMHRARAILVLQSLVYALQPQMDFNMEPLLKSPQFISAILTGIHTLIKCYRITWKECIESTKLVAIMLELLSHPNLSTRHSVQALQLLQLSIEHFLAPNLALLCDTLQGSGMEELGPVIYKKLHDSSWEIRDSALELLTSMVELSKMKFPPFQKYIVDTGICPIVFTIVQHDSESYVRASALTCLTEMMNVPLFWTEGLSRLDILPYLMQDVLLEESEGVVRREGVVLLTAIYEKKKLVQPICLDRVFSVMTYCAVNDLYWEVKTNALKFWMEVMCRQFRHQGVIDNTFPAVTFSREHRKIVQLTPKEILLRLTKVLNELSLRGCLGIFLHCLEDTADLEVVKVAATIVQRLQSFLDRYNYIDEVVRAEEKAASSSRSGNSETGEYAGVMDSNFNRDHSNLAIRVNGERNNADIGRPEVQPSASASASASEVDGVIESIVEAQDVNLLAHAYENQLQVAATNEETGEKAPSSQPPRIAEDYYKEFAAVTPKEFLDRVYAMDLDKLAENRSTWIAQIENFESLLDDILQGMEGENLQANDADCY